MNKKALSPLIATVLLIAFAVALGVMIMTWTQSIPNSNVNCAEIVLEEQNICYTGEQIRLQVRNSGKVDISGIQMRISDQIKEVDLKLKDSAIPGGANFNRDIEFAKVGIAAVEIFALVDEGGNLEMCSKEEIGIKTLPNC